MALSTGTGASILSAEQITNIVTVPLQKASVFLNSGVKIIDSSGPVRIPTYTGHTSPSWHGENELIDETEPTFGEVLLLNPAIKSVKALHRYSNELARQSVADTIVAIQSRMIADIAGKLDDTFLAGNGAVVSGTRTQPLGILNYAGTQQMTAVGVPELDDLHDAEGLALGKEVDPTALRWIMHSRDFVALRKIKDSAGRYIVQPDVTQAGGYQLLGHPVIVTNRMPVNGGTGNNESSIVLFDPSKVAVARDMTPTVTLLDQTFGDHDQQAIRVVARYDAAPINPEAIVVLRGVKLTA
ncbi:phage major capsid protein [Prescottella agglutinans]|uniref:HK97 family phage major capsid protein n=1 Tax=Prescottella agglutinans TaxID=1644129 RepID=A0ABT6MG41_9NOCA|nr:phage major capsid protein [Prescottella agglutinans]MDH6283287.1 HK97 family phage major capsid protein [Prescottella agglutinans]